MVRNYIRLLGLIYPSHVGDSSCYIVASIATIGYHSIGQLPTVRLNRVLRRDRWKNRTPAIGVQLWGDHALCDTIDLNLYFRCHREIRPTSSHVVDRADLHTTGFLPRIPLLTHCQPRLHGNGEPRYGDGDLLWLLIQASTFLNSLRLACWRYRHLKYQQWAGGACKESELFHLWRDRLPRLLGPKMLFLLFFEFRKRGTTALIEMTLVTWHVSSGSEIIWRQEWGHKS